MTDFSESEDYLAKYLSQDDALSGADKKEANKTVRRCPICREPVDMKLSSAPFCSDRCRTIDLGKWASGDYKISRPVEEEDLDQDD